MLIVLFLLTACNQSDLRNNSEKQQSAFETDVSFNSSLYPDIENYLIQSVPELLEYEKYISENSDGNAHLIIQVFHEVENVFMNDSKNECLGKFYFVYVGEQWDDHRVNWDWFYVREDLNDIFWYNLLEDKVFSLKEWRDSSYYRQF